MIQDRFLGMRITPLTRRRLHNFRANRRGFWSLWIFLAIFGFTLFAEVVANDKPVLIRYEHAGENGAPAMRFVMKARMSRSPDLIVSPWPVLSYSMYWTRFLPQMRLINACVVTAGTVVSALP